MDTLLAAESQEVTAWPQRLGLTFAVIAVIALAVWGMWRSWKRRAALDLPLLPVPAGFEPDIEVVGRYLGTAPAADWMQRIVASGLGAPGNAAAAVGSQGVRLERIGEPCVFLDAGQITNTALGRGVAGQVAEKDGVVLWFWQVGDLALQTGFRPDAAEDVVRLVQASQALVEENR
jgi:hypothetical protein